MTFVGQPTVVFGNDTTPERYALNMAHVKFGMPLEVWSDINDGWLMRDPQFNGNKLAGQRIYRAAQGAKNDS